MALLAYRGNPHSGGQGVYVSRLSRELVALGHHVEVLSGPPYPDLDPEVGFQAVPSLDLYRQPDPFRIPRPSEVHSPIDLLEFGLMCTAGFPEPLTFSLRARRLLAGRWGALDVVHDNQGLGRGLVGMMDDGWPVIATVHHPITVDRDLDLAHATNWRRRLTLRRWYGFVGMQTRVARQLPRVITVSESSRRDIAARMGVDLDRLSVVPVGVDPTSFRPLPGITPVPGRIMTTASADVPLKGLVPLLEAVARVRSERHADLVVVGSPRPESRVGATIARLGLERAVRFVTRVSEEDLVRLWAEAEVAAVPSLYEGFSLPAVEAMACGRPVVATTGGALPEVVGRDGETGLLVPPGNPTALARALGRVLDDKVLAARLGAAGRARVIERFTWRATAEATVDQYRALLATRTTGNGSRATQPAPDARAPRPPTGSPDDLIALTAPVQATAPDGGCVPPC
ncbi:MAG TPA: glycosyltransferase family 4 protein [Acidimicrobiales bacterium]|nr:glycosyltransferase family 4 protein [Acidimicrobiales bacterium]